MKPTKPNTLNVSRAIKDALKLCKLASKIDTADDHRKALKAAKVANEYAGSMRKRHGSKNVHIHTRTHAASRSPFNFRMTDIVIRTGRCANITISERSRFPRVIPWILS
jgi:hypothetical protein